jgi:hypothetical protein
MTGSFFLQLFDRWPVDTEKSDHPGTACFHLMIGFLNQ